uniref:Uncharacterized protein n=1 Tax=Arundo donax TaxID=35708 RepID=A0A0A8YMY3_ARUDO
MPWGWFFPHRSSFFYW